MEKKLQVRNLRISFRTVSGKVQAVRDISFDLHKGETLAIVGESGSGKSVTSKAILGILAGNSIVEDGEILYDGQDLLKIDEDDFYRIRGDKISMIFQDPLSSLNPIMRIGKQLTEAMMLKGKARQRNNRANFNEKMRLLEKVMCESDPSQSERARALCAQFRRFEMKHIELERSYNEAHEAALEALVEIENILFLIEKNAFADARNRLTEVRDFSRHAVDPYVVAEPDASELRKLTDKLLSGLSAQVRKGDYSETAQRLRALSDILRRATERTRPDFFALGFYQEEKGTGCPQGTQEEQNAFYSRYLNEHFMDDFIALAEKSIALEDHKYFKAREEAVEKLGKALSRLENAMPEDKELEQLVTELTHCVKATVNPLDVIKDSSARTFGRSLKDYMDTYFTGKRTNGGKVKKYERQMKRYNRLVEKGKAPDWKVAAASVIDLELVRENMKRLMSRLRDHFVELNAREAAEDKQAKTEGLIASLKESASGMVDKMTKRRAKNKALKLMEEVGIPEPRKRYRAYPFQFSGGMRQRIVIAIALAANPDILICDEPTTALDVTIQAQILELINRLKKERNLSIIFITHDLGVVANMADRITVMYAGKIVEYGKSEEVFYEPAHPYTWALLSSMPDLETKEKLEAIPGTPPNMIYPPRGDAFAERNRYALQIDFEEQPPIFPITDTHWAATWLLHPDAPKLQPPKTVTDRIQKMKARVGGGANA